VFDRWALLFQCLLYLAALVQSAGPEWHLEVVLALEPK
jgi:hypothetical protein